MNTDKRSVLRVAAICSPKTFGVLTRDAKFRRILLNGLQEILRNCPHLQAGRKLVATILHQRKVSPEELEGRRCEVRKLIQAFLLDGEKVSRHSTGGQEREETTSGEEGESGEEEEEM